MSKSYDAVPDCMKDESRWILSKDKKPVTPDGQPLYGWQKDSSRWMTFEEASLYVDDFELSFVLGDGWVGLDLDHVAHNFSLTHPDADHILSMLDGNGYAEFSPSGTGVHVIFQESDLSDTDDKGNKLKSKADLDSTAHIEFYTSGRQFRISGVDGHLTNEFGFDINNSDASKIQAVRNRYMVVLNSNHPVGRVLASDEQIGDADAYLDEIIKEGQITEGGRNAGLFRKVGHLAKKLGHCPVSTLSKARRLNQTVCNPPLPDAEVVSLTYSSINNTPRVDTAPPEKKAEIDMDECEFEAARAEAITDSLFATVRNNVPTEEVIANGGFLAEYLKYCQEHTLGDTSSLDMAGALSCFASILCGRVVLREATVLYPNMTILATAPSGTGKEFNRKFNKAILQRAELKEKIGTERLDSGQGLYRSLEGRADKLFQLDEVADTFGDNRNGQSSFQKQMANAFKTVATANGATFQPTARSDKSLNFEIHECCPTFYMTTTVDAFWNCFSRESAGDGFLGRMIYFEQDKVSRPKPIKGKPRVYNDGSDPPESIVQLATSWRSGTGDQQALTGSLEKIEFTLDEDAAYFCELEAWEISEKGKTDEDESTPLWNRSIGLVKQVALILAASREGLGGNLVVTLPDVELAYRIVAGSIRRLHNGLVTKLADNEVVKLSVRLERIASKIKKPWTVGQLASKGIADDGRKTRQNAIKHLIESGRLVECSPSPRGKSQYISISNWKEKFGRADA